MAKTGKAQTAKAKSSVTTDLVRRVTWDRNSANKKALPEFQTGDTIGVYVKVKEGEKERIQLFSGVVLKVQGSGSGRSFTVRKMSSGVGVERTFPMLSPSIDRIELISRGKVRRSRLFYLRGLKGRSARLNSEIIFGADAGGEGAVGAADEIKEAVTPAAPAPVAADKKESASKKA